jgi:hypothetical protein
MRDLNRDELAYVSGAGKPKCGSHKKRSSHHSHKRSHKKQSHKRRSK